MLELTIAELAKLMSVYAKGTFEDLENVDPIWAKLYAEKVRLDEAAEKAAAVEAAEAERLANRAAVIAAYPVAEGDTVRVKIGKLTYRARVLSISPGTQPYHRADTPYLHLTVLTKSGEPNRSMNGGKHGGGWFGWVVATDITKVPA